MKSKISMLARILILLIILLSLTGGLKNSVQAATCTWLGSTPSWSIPANWSCGHVPTTGDDIIIPSTGINPVMELTNIDANTMNLEAGAVLTVNASSYSPTIWASNFSNDGEIVINGVNPGSYGLEINSPAFTNNGTITINAGYLSLVRGGTHTGSFVGAAGTVLSFSSSWPDQIHNFTVDSLIQVPITILAGNGSTVNILGEYSPGLVLDDQSRLSIMATTTVNLDTEDVLMPVEVSAYGTLYLPDTPLDVEQLAVGYGGLVTNTQTLNIIDTLELKGGTLSGSGTIIVPVTADTFTILGGGTISGKSLQNNITANWNSGNMTLSNSAVLLNNGTFNAINTTTITGSSPAEFVNNGVFDKKTSCTTTTMNIPFTNNNSIEITAGELIFQQGIQSETSFEINLGSGTLDPGETLTLGASDSLIGSGTLSSNLVNGGSVSPGASPGTINVSGNYTQNVTGVLEMELGGTTAGTEYDQLVVSGSAALDGTLQVSLDNSFNPVLGDSFTLMTYASSTGSFSTTNLPITLGEGLHWEIDQQDTALVLRVVSEGWSISGTVNYIGDESFNPVSVALFLDPGSGPVETIISTSTNGLYDYTFSDVPDGTYYLGALMDLNGNHQPDPDEPFAWYGDPTEVVVDGADVENINFTLDDPGYEIFLPMILN